MTKGRNHAVAISGLCSICAIEKDLLSAACRSQERIDCIAGECTTRDRFRVRDTSGSVTIRP